MLDRLPRSPRIPGKTVVKIAWYRADQWDRLREVSEDREDLDETYDAWHAREKKRLMKLTASGERPVRIPVDVEELIAWCKAADKVVNAESRDLYLTLDPAERPE